MAPWSTVCIGNPPIPICIWMKSYTTTQPMSILYSWLWYIQPEQCATCYVSQRNWISYVVYSNRMATVTDTSVVLSIHLAGRTHLEKNQHQWPPYPLWDPSSFNCISRVLTRHNIKTVGLPPRKVASFLHEDDLVWKQLVFAAAPMTVVRTTLVKQSIPSKPSMIKEHHQHIKLYHPDKSAMAEHSIDLSHCIQFQDTRIQARKTEHNRDTAPSQ